MSGDPAANEENQVPLVSASIAPRSIRVIGGFVVNGFRWLTPSRATFVRMRILLICLLFQVALPLIVLAPEYLRTSPHSVRPAVVATFLPVYLLGMAVSCCEPAAFCAGIVIAVASGFIFGVDAAQVDPKLATDALATELMHWAAIVVVVIFVLDRAYHHLVLGDGFGPFEG